MNNIELKDALELAEDNYKDYSLYVAQGRAFPNIKDGAKSVAKRSIYGMYKDGPRSKVKLAKLASYALPYHPHPTSIAGAITQLGDNGNVLKLIDTQGNWGDSTKGIKAAAERYIEGRLSDLAIDLFCDSVEYCNFIKGEIDEDEPEALPAYLPLCFINGVEGIPSGLPKINIPTIDIDDMISYYQSKLKKKDITFIPVKVPKLNVRSKIISKDSDWKTVLDTGKGSVRLAPVMSIDSNNLITITELPQGKDMDSVFKILEKEILLDKIDARDESTTSTNIVIEKVKNKSCDMQEIYKRLYNKLQTSISYNMAFFDNDNIYVPCSFEKVVQSNLQYVIDTHKNRLVHQIDDANRKLTVLNVIESLKSNTNNLHALFQLDFDQACNSIMTNYNVDIEISKSVLQKPISYLTREHSKEIQDLKDLITKLNNDNSDIYQFLYDKYSELKTKIHTYQNERKKRGY